MPSVTIYLSSQMIPSFRFGRSLLNGPRTFLHLYIMRQSYFYCKVLVSSWPQVNCIVSLHHWSMLGLTTTTSPSKSSAFSSPVSSIPFLERLSWLMSVLKLSAIWGIWFLIDSDTHHVTVKRGSQFYLSEHPLHVAIPWQSKIDPGRFSFPGKKVH